MAQYALCMGVSDYSQWRNIGWDVADLPYSTLNAQAFATLLTTKFGFSAANVGVQLDSWCNYGNVANALNTLFNHKVQSGDVICLFFSGHGTRIPDPTAGTGLWYDALIPYAGNLLTDYEFTTLAAQLDDSSIALTVILDTGFTGGAARIPAAPQPAGVPLSAGNASSFVSSARAISVPGLCLSAPAAALGTTPITVQLNSGALAITEPASAQQVGGSKGIVITACGQDQSNWQPPALQSSVFLSALTKALQPVTGSSPIALSDLLTALQAGAAPLAAQYVTALPSFATQLAVPQLYAQPSRLSENFLAPRS